jgi:hypothetical protein
MSEFEDLNTLVSHAKDKLNAWNSEIGFTEEEREADLKSVHTRLRAFLKDCCDAKEAHVIELQGLTVSVAAEIKSILAALESSELEIAAVDTKPRGVYLRDKVQSLQADLAVVAERRDQRVAQISAKFTELTQLWEAMGTAAKLGFEAQGEDISASRLAALAEEAATAAAERTKLQNAVLELCQEIFDQLTELGIAGETGVDANDEVGALIGQSPRAGADVASTLERLPLGELEQRILERQFDAIGVHAATVKLLQDRTVLLSEMRKERTSKLHEFAQSIMPLWRRLSVPIDEQQAWVKNNGGLSIQALRSCQLEIIRLLQLQQEALGPMIAAARGKITELWDHLMISQDERVRFADFRSEELSDEVLQAHEQHISLLTARANAMRPVLELIARRDELKRTALVLADMEQDPDRYKKPRHLIEEERLRKQLRSMPKVEAEIRAQVPAWEEQYGEFKVDGVRYLDLMEDDIEAEHARREEDRLAKEREREAKKMAKSQGVRSGADVQPFGRTATGKATIPSKTAAAGTKKGTGKEKSGSKENVCA